MSESTPWQTWDKVQAEFTAGNILPYTVIHARKGDTWTTNNATGTGTYGSTMLVVDVDNVAIVADWGSGANPLIDRFTKSYTSGWTLVSGSMYSRSESDTITALVNDSDRLTPLNEADSSANVPTQWAGTSGSWYYDSATTTLYVDLGGTDPNTVTIAAAINNGASCIELAGDQTLVRDLDTHGWGTSTTAGNGSAIVLNTTGGRRCAVFGGTHVYTNDYTIRGLGDGTLYVRDCTAGFTSNDDYTIYAEASTGTNHLYVRDCTLYGRRPESSWVDVDGGKYRAGGGVRHKCDSGNTGRTILYNVNSKRGYWGTNQPYWIDNPVVCDTTTWLDCNHHVVQCESLCDGLQANRWSSGKIPGDYTVAWGCNWEARTPDDELTYRYMISVPGNGLVINTRIDFTKQLNKTGWFGIWNTASGSPYLASCDFIVRPNNGDCRVFWIGGSGAAAINNCVQANLGAGTMNPSHDNPPNYNCAYYDTLNNGGDPSPVTITNAAETDPSHVPASGDAIYAAAATDVPVPRLDRLGNVRPSTPSIGDIG